MAGEDDLLIDAQKPPIDALYLFGDSLSDHLKKYNQRIFGIPYRWIFRWIFPKSHGDFTDAFAWPVAVANTIGRDLEEKNFCINMAEGGATAYDYRSLSNLFSHPKGFFLSFFLNNLEKQTRDLIKKGVQPNGLCTMFIGANDFLTLGYCDDQGVAKALQGIQASLDRLSAAGIKNVVLCPLPDFSKTPRFAEKSVLQKQQAERICVQFNDGLKKLEKSYRCMDFSLCTIYQVEDEAGRQKALRGINHKGIIIVGKGQARKIYFAEHGKFICQHSGEEIVLDIALSRAQRKLLGSVSDRAIVRDSGNTMGLDKLIQQITSKAKLSTQVKIFPMDEEFKKLNENPEACGITRGCAVYYNYGDLDLSNITGNAVVLSKLAADKVEVYLIKDGKLVERPVQNSSPWSSLVARFRTQKVSSELEPVTMTLGEYQPLLKDALEKLPKTGLVRLAAADADHGALPTYLIEETVKAFRASGVKVTVADMLKGAYWGDVHPSGKVHLWIADKFLQYLRKNYQIVPRSSGTQDGTVIEEGKRTELPPSSKEAPVLFQEQEPIDQLEEGNASSSSMSSTPSCSGQPPVLAGEETIPKCIEEPSVPPVQGPVEVQPGTAPAQVDVHKLPAGTPEVPSQAAHVLSGKKPVESQDYFPPISEDSLERSGKGRPPPPVRQLPTRWRTRLQKGTESVASETDTQSPRPPS